MHVAEVTAFGGPEVLRITERPDPAPAPGEVVVRIRAANVNPTDLSVRSGQARRRLPELQPPFVPGWDLAGEVTAVGSEATGFAPGDRVLGMIPFGRIGGRVGAYAQAAAVDPGWLAPLATDIDDPTAATLPLNALTAQQALDLIAAPPGATLLITGASGAVGGFATQLAARAGCRVLAQASDDDEEWVASLGATEVLPRADRPRDDRPGRRRPRRRPARARGLDRRPCATAGSPSSPARRSPPSRRAACASRPSWCSPTPSSCAP